MQCYDLRISQLSFKATKPKSNFLKLANFGKLTNSGNFISISNHMVLFSQYGSDRKYVGEELFSRKTKNYNKSSPLKNFVINMLRFFKSIFSKTYFVLTLKFLFQKKKKLSSTFLVKEETKAAPSIKTPAIINAVVDSEVKGKKQAMAKKVIDYNTAIKTKDLVAKETEDKLFADRLAKANKAAELSLEGERKEAIKYAKTLNYKAVKSSSIDSDSKSTTSDLSITTDQASNVVDLSFFNSFFSNEQFSKDKIKSTGLSGIISYISTELVFWSISLPVIIALYHSDNGEWLNFADKIDRV
jgi:hypothetical protein